MSQDKIMLDYSTGPKHGDNTLMRGGGAGMPFYGFLACSRS